MYDAYAHTLRTWFVAYGVGGPVLFMTQQHVSDGIAASGHGRLIVCMFLPGVACQIVLALLNKWNNWFLYSHSETSQLKTSWKYKVPSKISEQWWIDLGLDLATFVFFGLATLKVLLLFT